MRDKARLCPLPNPGALLLAATLALAVSIPPAMSAQGVREFRPIAVPDAPVPTGGIPLAGEVAPPERGKAVSAMREALEQWNSPAFAESIGEDFEDRRRLIDNFGVDVPPNAELDVLSVRNFRPLQSYGERPSSGGNPRLITRAQVTADTQIFIDDPGRGFRRLEGSNDFVVEIVEELVPVE